MATMVLPGEQFLNPFYIDQELRAAMEPQLYFNGVLPQTDVTERNVIYDMIENTAAADVAAGVSTIPMPTGEDAALTELKMTNISEMKGKIPKIGFEFDLSREMLLNKARTSSELDLRLKKAGYIMAYALNNMTIDALSTNATASTHVPSVAWDASSGKQNPIKDITSFYFDFINKEYPNRANTFFMNQNHIEAFVEHLNDAELDYTFENENVISVPGSPSLQNMKFVNVYDQYTDNHLLMMDLRPQVHPGAEIWRYNDPEFGVQAANPQSGTPDYTGIHVNVTREDKNPFPTTVEIWMNVLPTVKIAEVIVDGGSI